MMPLTMMHGESGGSPRYEWMRLAIYGDQGGGWWLRPRPLAVRRCRGCQKQLAKENASRMAMAERKRKWKCANAIVTDTRTHT